MSSSLPASLGSSSSRSLPSTLPSDPSEISETAQALLQVHYGRLKTSPSSSSSSNPDGEHSLLAKLEASLSNIDRICLQLDNLAVTHQLHAGKDSKKEATKMLQPMGPLAFWPARLVLHKEDGEGEGEGGKVWVRQGVEGLGLRDLVKVEDEVLPMLTKAPSSEGGGTGLSVQVKLTEPSRTVEVKYVRMGYKDAQMELQRRRGVLLGAVRELRSKLGVGAVEGGKARVEEKAAVEKGMHMLNEDNQALNEEGLPFYEPVEEISEEEATRKKKAYMQPFVRKDQSTTDKEQRKRWLEDTLSKLEEEEQHEDSDEEDEEMSTAPSATSSEMLPSAEEETRVILRTRTPSPPPSPEDALKTKALPEIVSASRPAPAKSALKPSASRPDLVQRPSFGSAGIRHGFLNLNPSSPGAIKSSYSWEDLEKEEKPKYTATESERSSRSHTPALTAMGRNSSTAGSSLLSRVADVSSPMTSGTSTPTKKSVRIKSPERAHPEAATGSGLTPLQRALRSSIRVKENYTEPGSSQQQTSDTVSALNKTDSGSGTAEKRHKDDVGVEEEAERIVRLLGPDVVEGHPGAPPSDVLKKMQEAHEEDKRFSTPEAVAARAKMEEEQREKERLERMAEKPALGHSVMERPRGSVGGEKGKAKGKEVENQVKANQARFSAFKAGFLNQKPTKFVPNQNVPRNASGGSGVSAPPTQSLGMSALDRASLGDDELSRRREEMGLPAAVPHARPSKAYAEKMAARQQGIETSSGKDDDEVASGDMKVKLARPVAGDDVPRPGRVRFGPPAGAADDEGEEEQDGLEINPAASLENHQPEEEELDEEQEEPKIEGEGADTDEEDAYFDEYLSKRSSKAAAAESRGLGSDDDGDGDDFGDDDEEDWDVDEDDFDDDEDDDFDYDPEDLMALAPRMGDADGLVGNPELLREYEGARAKLAAMGLAMPSGGGVENVRAQMVAAARSAGDVGGDEDEEEEDDYEMDVVPLDAAVEDPEYQGNTTSSAASGSRISRFKASLKQQAMAPTPQTKTKSSNLEEMLSSAKNLGSSNSAAFGIDGMSGPSDREEGSGRGAPMMIIPQLAPVRFPKNGDLVEGKTTGPVDLDGGESDEDDEKAEMVMRSRLERLQWKQEHPEEAKRMKVNKKAQGLVEQGVAPPPVAARRQEMKTTLVTTGGGTADEGTELVEATKPKKVSRFKAARMGQ